MIAAIGQLSPRSYFNVIGHYSAENSTIWSEKSERATRANKGSAMQWIRQLAPMEDSCMEGSMLAAVRMAHEGHGRSRQMIFASNMPPRCVAPGYEDEVLRSVTAANAARIPIHTVFLLGMAPDDSDGFWRTLAAQNRGRYTLISDL